MAGILCFLVLFELSVQDGSNSNIHAIIEWSGIILNTIPLSTEALPAVSVGQKH